MRSRSPFELVHRRSSGSRGPYAEQLRWRTQRCPQRAAAPTAADLALTDWEPFDPLVHHAYVNPRLPTHGRRPPPDGEARKAVRR